MQNSPNSTHPNDPDTTPIPSPTQVSLTRDNLLDLVIDLSNNRIVTFVERAPEWCRILRYESPKFVELIYSLFKKACIWADQKCACAMCHLVAAKEVAEMTHPAT